MRCFEFYEEKIKINEFKLSANSIYKSKKKKTNKLNSDGRREMKYIEINTKSMVSIKFKWIQLENRRWNGDRDCETDTLWWQ